jgi:hypothetical protein
MHAEPARGGALIDADELPSVQRDVDAVLAQPMPPGCERPHNTLAPLRWDHEIVQRLLRSERRRRALVHAIRASGLRWISAYVSVKDPRSEALWWHQDWWCWDHPISYRRDAAQVAVLCYLTPTTCSNGALRVLPGTHHRSIELHAALPEAHTRESRHVDSEDPAMRDHEEQLTLAVGAGDAVALDYRLLHATHANRSAIRRDCLVLTYAPAWHQLPIEVRAHLIRHPAQPWPLERMDASLKDLQLLPAFDDEPRDLKLNRVAPASFTAS